MRLQHCGAGGGAINEIYEEAAVMVYLPWTYLDGSSQERQEIATHGQQDKHAVEVEAGSRSPGPGQSVLVTKTKSVKTECEDLRKPDDNKTRTFAER